MKKLTALELVEKTELNDFKVKSIELDIKNFFFSIELEGAYFFENKSSSPVALENGGEIKVKNYTAFEARYFLPKEKLWKSLDYENLEKVVEINDKSYKDAIFRLAGSGGNGYWVEYLIDGGEIEINFVD